MLSAALTMASAGADTVSVTARSTQGPDALASIQLPTPTVPNHPLLPVVKAMLAGESGQQPKWKLPMLLNGLTKRPQTAHITSYCEQCCDGGGVHTRWGSHLRRGICAADPRYWGPGSVIWLGSPINEVVVVEDTGGAIKGPDRFDYCATGHPSLCNQIGRRSITYVPLYRVAPQRRWGSKPAGWQPPVLDMSKYVVKPAAPAATQVAATSRPVTATPPPTAGTPVLIVQPSMPPPTQTSPPDPVTLGRRPEEQAGSSGG